MKIYKKTLSKNEIKDDFKVFAADYMAHCEDKIKILTERMNLLFQKHKIEKGTLIENIEEILKKQKTLKLESRLRSAIYSYDIKDNDVYKGVQEVEDFISQRDQSNAKDLLKNMV